MSLQVKDLRVGEIWGVIMDFDFVGDELPNHTHKEDSAHITIVARGKVKMEIGTKYEFTETHELNAGACIDTPAGLWHRITALENNSRIYNIAKTANVTTNPARTTGFDLPTA